MVDNLGAENNLPSSTRARVAFRVAGSVLLVAGIVLGGLGILQFIKDFDSMDSGLGWFLKIAAGGFLCVFGFAALSAGTLETQAQYVAGETMAVVKQSAAYLSGDETKTRGPFCNFCGRENVEDANFCNSCGKKL